MNTLNLAVKEELCDGCGDCEKACQKKALRLLGGYPNFCRNCAEPECMDVCARGAIKIAGGIIQIDESACDGCGKCLRACNWRAIYRNGTGKAVKCDFCSGHAPECALSCKKNAITFLRAEKNEGEKNLGWGFETYDARNSKRPIERSADGIVYLDRQNTPCYCHTGLRRVDNGKLGAALDVIELFKEYAREDRIDLPIAHENAKEARLRTKEHAGRILRQYTEKHGMNLAEEDETNLLEIITASVGGNLGPIDFLAYNDSFEEIIYNGLGSNITVKHKKYGRLRTNLYFTDAEFAKENVVNKIAEYVGVPNISERNPVLPATLPNNDRLHALSKPIVKDIAFTIRHFNSNPLTLPELIDSGTISTGAGAYLWLAMELGKTIFVVGSTSSGKTTLLSALMPFIPPDRRILCLEDVREIIAPHQDFLVHRTDRARNIGMEELIHSALRETPDRVVMGEVRTPEEIRAFLELAQAGPGEGSYATFHGETLETALMRLKHHGISEVDLPGAVHLMVLIKRRREYDQKRGRNVDRRFVSEIAEIAQSPLLEKIFARNPKTRALIKVQKSKMEAEFAHAYFGGDLKRTGRELKRREKKLAEWQKKRLDYRQFSEALREFYGSGHSCTG